MHRESWSVFVLLHIRATRTFMKPPTYTTCKFCSILWDSLVSTRHLVNLLGKISKYKHWKKCTFSNFSRVSSFWWACAHFSFRFQVLADRSGTHMCSILLLCLFWPQVLHIVRSEMLFCSPHLQRVVKWVPVSLIQTELSCKQGISISRTVWIIFGHPVWNTKLPGDHQFLKSYLFSINNHTIVKVRWH